MREALQLEGNAKGTL